MDEVTLHLGDCLEIMKTIPDKSIDLILTDPPYNIGQENKRTKVGNKIVSNKEAWGEWDDMDNKDFDAFMFSFIKEAYRLLKEGGGILLFHSSGKKRFLLRLRYESNWIYLSKYNSNYKRKSLTAFY